MIHPSTFVCLPRIVAGAVAVVLTIGLPAATLAKPYNVLVVGPLGAGASEASAASAVQAIVKAITDNCGGYSASTFDPKTSKLGSEDYDLYVNAQAPTQPGGASGADAKSTIQLIDVTVVEAKSHTPVLTQPAQSFNANDASVQNFCTALGSGTGKTGPVDASNFLNIVPDADTDRQFSDVLLYQLRQFGFDGALAPVNFDQAQQLIGSTCGTGRGILRYHVIQSNNEKKAIGATEIATAVAGSILHCGSAPVSVDTFAAPQQSQNHFISVGTLVGSLVGLAVALKPRISTPQLTSAIPLFSGMVNTATLSTDNQKAASDAFGLMLYRYCHPTDKNIAAPAACRTTTPAPSTKRSIFNLQF